MPKYDVFLSHNSTDKPAVEELARRLAKAGLEPWLDKWNLIPGDPWQEAIEQALEECASCAVFIGPSGTGPWQNEEMRAAIDRRVRESEGRFRVIPVLLPGAKRDGESRLPTFLTATTWVEFREGLDDEDAFHRLVSGVRGEEPGPGPGRAIFEGECPYRGLEVFDTEHAPLFFGREAVTAKLVERLKNERFLAVIGPSGSGKSSVVRAGLVHALQQGSLPGSADWQVMFVTPAAHPLEELALGFTSLLPDRTLRLVLDDLEADQRGLHLLTREALGEQRLLLVIDQFEELFTLCRSEQERQLYLDDLLYAVGADGGPVTLVLTMRADFYGKCALYPALANQLEKSQALIGPMSDEELRRAVESPAKKVGLSIEPGLIDLILDDVHAQPGALPLLQYALLELWKRRERNRLTLQGYQEAGGVQGALARRADTIYAELGFPQQTLARQILLRLTELGEGTEDTRRRVQKQELISIEPDSEPIETVLKVLADARLITTSGQTETGEEWVDVAHEALIRGWPRLQTWLTEDRESLRTHRQLTEAAQEWQRHGHDESYLFRGGRLAAIEEWVKAHESELNELEQAFVIASITAREVGAKAARRRVQWTIGLLSTGLILITGLAILANSLRIESSQRANDLATAVNEVDLARQTAVAGENAAQVARGTAVAGEEQARQSQAQAEFQARLALSRQLANQAAFYRDTDPQLALLLATQAVSITYYTDGYTTLEASAALRGVIRALPVLVAPLGEKIDNTSNFEILQAVFSPDGQQIVTVSWDKTARIWDRGTGEELAVLEGHTDAVVQAVFSPDGQQLVTVSEDDTARIWDRGTGEELAVLEGHTDDVVQAVFSPDGQQLVTVSKDGTARIWDRGTGTQLARLGTGHSGGVYQAAFSPDGQQLVTASGDKTARIWDTGTGEELAVLTGHSGVVVQAAFSPDGQQLVTASWDKTARIWDRGTGEELVVLEGHTDNVTQALFSPDGQQIVTVSWDGTARIWDRETGEELAVLEGHSGGVRQAAFSPDGQQLVTVSSGDKTARIWDRGTGTQLARLGTGYSGRVRQAAFSPDGQQLVTASWDNTARIWDRGTGEELAVLEGHTRGVVQALFSPDGQQIVTASSDGTARIWDRETGEELAVLEGHSGGVRQAAFSPDGQQIVTASGDGTVRVWDRGTGEEVAVLVGHTEAVVQAVFSPGGQQLVTVSEDGTARIWDRGTGEELAMLEGHSGGTRQAAISPDGQQLVMVSWNGTALVWMIQEETDRVNLVGQNLRGVFRAVFDPGGQSVASGGQDGVARLWDAKTGRGIASMTGHGSQSTGQEGCPQCIQTLSFNPAGNRLLTAGWDGTARVWDAQSGTELLVLEGHPDGLVDAVFNPAGTLVATSGKDGTVRVWDANNGDQLFVQQAAVNDLNFSPDGSHLSGAGAKVWLWDVASGKEKIMFEGDGQSFIHAVFSPDGQRVAAAGFNGIGYVWDIETGSQVAILQGHTGEIWQIVYSPSGEMLATTSEDGTVRLWHADSGEELFVLRGHDQGVVSLAFNPNGRQIATGGVDGTVRLWNTQTGDPEAILPDFVGTGVLINWEVDREKSQISSEDPSAIHWVQDVSYSPSGDRVVAASLDGSVTIYVADAGKLLEIAQAQLTRQLTCAERVQFLYEELDCLLQETPTPAPQATGTAVP